MDHALLLGQELAAHKQQVEHFHLWITHTKTRVTKLNPQAEFLLQLSVIITAIDKRRLMESFSKKAAESMILFYHPFD